MANAQTKLISYLDDHGIKRSWLAEKIGVARSTLSMMLAGKRSINEDRRHEIAKALRVGIRTIF